MAVCILFTSGFYGSSFFAYEAIAIREGRLTMMNRDFSRLNPALCTTIYRVAQKMAQFFGTP